MGYRVDYSELKALLGSYNSAVASWSEGISSVMAKEAVIEASTNIAGNRADHLKAYLNTTYSAACSSLATLLGLFQQNFLLYTNDYYQRVDQAADTCIDEAELNERRASLQGKRSEMQQIGLAAETSVKSVSDLVSVPSVDISEPDMKLGNILTSLDDLDEAVNGLEGSHVSADFGEIDGLISKTDAFFQELFGLNEDFKTSFTTAGFAALSSASGLAVAMMNAQNQLTAQESDVALAAEKLEKLLELEQAEREKREKQAKWAKAAVTVVTVAVTGISLATGVGTLLVPVVCSMGRSAFNAAADEYTEFAWDANQWDRAVIGKEAIKGWFSGFTGAILPPGTGDIVKTSLSASNSALWGGLDNAYEQLTTTGSITDTKSIFFDVAKSGTSSFASTLVGDAISDQVEELPVGLGLDRYVNPSNDIRHYAGEFIKGGTSEVTSGIFERLTSTTVETAFDVTKNVVEGEDTFEGVDFVDRYQKVMSFEEISMDFAKGSTKETVTSYFEERTPDPNTGLTPIIQSKLSAVDEKELSEILRNMETKSDDPVMASLEKLEGRTDDYYVFGDAADLNGVETGWNDWNSEEHDRMMEKLAEMDDRGGNAREYEMFGDPRGFSYQRNVAVKDAWEQERQLVLQGKGTRDWTVSQQEELIRTGKVSGFDGSHMLDASSNPAIASNPDNIQMLTYEEHIYGAHDGNTRNPTTGRFDPSTGETEALNPRQLPHRDEVAFELTDKFDYRQLNLADQLGSSFGYNRGSKPN